MATQTTSTSALSDTMKTLYARQLLMEAEPNLLHARFGQTGRFMPGMGKTIEMRKFSALATKTGTLTEGVTPNPDDLTVTAITATAEQVGAYVQHSDLLQLTAFDPVISETMRLQGDQAGRTYDYRVREVINAGTSVTYVGQSSRGAITTSDVITETIVKKAVRTLRSNNARGFADLGGTFVGIVDPEVEYDLLNTTEFKNVYTYNQAMADKFMGLYLGTAWGVTWFRTTQAKVFTGEGSGGIDVHSTMILGQGAFGVYVLQDLEPIVKPVGYGDDPLNQRGSIGWKGSFISKILFDAYMHRIESAVSS